MPEEPPPILRPEQIKAILDACAGTDFEARRDTALVRMFVSRTFKTLARDAYLSRARGASYLADREGLLAAWVASPAPSTGSTSRQASSASTRERRCQRPNRCPSGRAVPLNLTRARDWRSHSLMA